MPFRLVTEVGLGMGVLDFGGDRRRGKGSLGVNLGRPIVTNGAFATRSSHITLRTCIALLPRRTVSVVCRAAMQLRRAHQLITA